MGKGHFVKTYKCATCSHVFTTKQIIARSECGRFKYLTDYTLKLEDIEDIVKYGIFVTTRTNNKKGRIEVVVCPKCHTCHT